MRAAIPQHFDDAEKARGHRVDRPAGSQRFVGDRVDVPAAVNLQLHGLDRRPAQDRGVQRRKARIRRGGLGGLDVGADEDQLLHLGVVAFLQCLREADATI